MQNKLSIVAISALLALSACGETLLQQGLMGAGAGAAAATVMGGDAITGAALGSAANVLYCRRNPGSC